MLSTVTIVNLKNNYFKLKWIKLPSQKAQDV